MPHATSRRSDSGTHSDDAPSVGEKLVPAAKTCRTLCTSPTKMLCCAAPFTGSIVLVVEELNGADQAAGDAASETAPVAVEKSHCQQPLGQCPRPSEPHLSLTSSITETIFLESCDITEVDVSFAEIPVELTVVGTSQMPRPSPRLPFHSSKDA